VALGGNAVAIYASLDDWKRGRRWLVDRWPTRHGCGQRPVTVSPPPGARELLVRLNESGDGGYRKAFETW